MDPNVNYNNIGGVYYGTISPGDIISTSANNAQPQMARFKNGDRVALIKIIQPGLMATNDPRAIPVWGDNGDYIAGVVTATNGAQSTFVQWDNGMQNAYYEGAAEIQLATEAKKKKKMWGTSKGLDTIQMDRLVMKKEAKDEIVAVLKQHQHQQKLFEEWGLGEVIEYGRGMTFLFWGGPGTGKTWGANCIAKALGTELLTIAAGDIQSSEPGGANRAITEAFAKATKEGKVLFIDECDSLITVRSEVGMILGSEINTLLTEIEKYEGVLILATNRIHMMDEALERRIALIVEFPEPDFASRELIWEKMLPLKMPREKVVTAKKLAEEKLTGGQIKNAVLQAARLALADESKEVSHAHFTAAIKRIHSSKSLMGKGSELARTAKMSSGVEKVRSA